MQDIPGTIEKGKIKIDQPIPAADGTNVIVFIMPQKTELNLTESLFGKWKWYSKEIEGEISNAWEKWSKEQNPI